MKVPPAKGSDDNDPKNPTRALAPCIQGGGGVLSLETTGNLTMLNVTICLANIFATVIISNQST